MASVNWKKLHGAGEVKALLRHDDKEMRLKDNHANEHIDKEKTPYNLTFKSYYDEEHSAKGDGCYKRTCAEYDRRIAQYDAGLTKKPRKDRVTAVALEIPFPGSFRRDRIDERGRAWAQETMNILKETFGEENILRGYVHVDEVHEYHGARTEKVEDSRIHIHTAVFPDVDGKLNGKAFVTRDVMKSLNRAIDKMTREKFGCEFMTGEGTKYTDTVEQLKIKSQKQKIESQKQELEEKQRQIDRLEKEADARLSRAKKQEEALLKSQEETKRAQELADCSARVVNDLLVAAEVPDGMGSSIPLGDLHVHLSGRSVSVREAVRVAPQMLNQSRELMQSSSSRVAELLRANEDFEEEQEEEEWDQPGLY